MRSYSLRRTATRPLSGMRCCSSSTRCERTALSKSAIWKPCLTAKLCSAESCLCEVRALGDEGGLTDALDLFDQRLEVSGPVVQRDMSKLQFLYMWAVTSRK